VVLCQYTVTETIKREAFIDSLGHITRIRSNVEKTRKISGPRSLHGSQWGLVCPCDTPEGDQCGLVKSLSLLAHVTTDHEAGPINQVLFSLGMEDIRMVPSYELYSQHHQQQVSCRVYVIGLCVCVLVAFAVAAAVAMVVVAVEAVGWRVVVVTAAVVERLRPWWWWGLTIGQFSSAPFAFAGVLPLVSSCGDRGCKCVFVIVPWLRSC
jgi:hypothetical protein